jgi:CRP-like cAMP-binding protein
LDNATARRFIYDVPMFQQLVEPRFIAMLATMLKPQSYKRGQVLINRGEIGTEMFFIMTGTAAAQLDLEVDALAVGTLGPGSFFGEQAMIKDEPRNAYVKAVTDVEVLVLEKADMMKALEAFPALVELLFKETMEQRITTNEQREANYQPSWTARQPIDPRARQPDDPKPSWHSRSEQHFEATAAQALPPNKATVIMPATNRLPEQRFAPCSPRRRALDGYSVGGTDAGRRAAVFQRQIAESDHKGITGAAEMKFTPPWQQQAQVSPRVAAAQARVVPRVGGPASSWHTGLHPWTNGGPYGRQPDS